MSRLDPMEFARLTHQCEVLGQLEACAHDRDTWTVAERFALVSKRLLYINVGWLDEFELAACLYAFAKSLRESSTFPAAKPTEGGIRPAPAGLQLIVWDEPVPAPGEKPSLIANAPTPIDLTTPAEATRQRAALPIPNAVDREQNSSRERKGE